MLVKELVTIALESSTRFEVYSSNCELVVASDDTIYDAWMLGYDKMLELEVAYINIVHTEKQPLTLQICTR